MMKNSINMMKKYKKYENIEYYQIVEIMIIKGGLIYRCFLLGTKFVKYGGYINIRVWVCQPACQGCIGDFATGSVKYGGYASKIV
jgi:hypothetical protein